MESAPLVSFVTPFYNTREYLTECIESVLGQTYQNWEYILVNNCSTDGSREIAEKYAQLHPDKIRLLRTGSFLTQVQNYNFAISSIAAGSKYCKMVQADDWIFPNCVRDMVEVAEAHPEVGIVGAYELAGDCVDLDGLTYPSIKVSGRDICRLYLLKNKYLFGTPTSLLLRSDLVRSRVPFYSEQYAPFEDAHVCFDLLQACDFGFVHQVLTYSRRDNESILSRARALGLLHFSRFAIVKVHGQAYLSPEEYDRCLKDAKRRYFLYLCRCALRGRDKGFWEFHRKGMASIQQELNWRLLAPWIPRAVLEKTWESGWALWDKGSSLALDE